MNIARSARASLPVLTASLLSAWLAAQGAAREAGGPGQDEVLRTRRVELVNGDGELCLVLRGTPQGGAASWYVPAPAGDLPAKIGRDDRETLAFLGSIFEGSVDFAMGQVPMDGRGVGLHMSVHGEPRRADIVVSHRGEHRNLAR